MRREPTQVKVNLPVKQMLYYGLQADKVYEAKPQEREIDDDSKIVYIYDPREPADKDPAKKHLICLCDGEYQIISTGIALPNAA